jgi:hypothetical protein
VLAIVEYQKADSAFQRGGHRFAHRHAWLLLGDAKHCGHCVRNCGGIDDRGEFENPYAVGEFVSKSRRNPDRQPGLADSTHPRQRDKPMRSHG